MSTPTAITAQDTCGVFAVEATPPALVWAQIAAVLDYIPSQTIKFGMVALSRIVAAIAAAIRDCVGRVELNSVMVTKSDDALQAGKAEAAPAKVLLLRADIMNQIFPAQDAEKIKAQGPALRGSARMRW